MLPEQYAYGMYGRDARLVPLAFGSVDRDDFIDDVSDFIRFIGPDTHIIAVCQPSVPVLAAVAAMAAEDDPLQPASMTLMGGPIDTRRNPTVVNELAASRPLEWFERTVIHPVPLPNPGAFRSEEHTSELQSLMRISYAVFCLNKKNKQKT